MEPAETLPCLVCIFAYLINLSESVSLTYPMPESLPVNSTIGNIAVDSDIRSMVSEDNFKNLEFYFLSGNNKYLKYVAIDSVTSNLTVKEVMDREVICEFAVESICSFKFEVAIRSKIDTLFLKFPVEIQLEDINDNAPSFKNSHISRTISEEEVVGKSIEIDRAKDSDSANFSVSSYELSPSNVPFDIVFDSLDEDASLSLVISEQLDRETTDRYTFDIIAFDGGVPPLNGSMTINIIVEDANDNKPEFNQDLYKVTVKENFPVNATFLTVAATDSDQNENANISYRISVQQSEEIQNTFGINSSSGDLYLISHLVYESDEAIRVKIEAVDHGARPLSSTATVEVTIEDSVNVQPLISLNLLSQSNTAVVTEVASVGTVVAYVQVTDNDGGRNGLIDCAVNSEYFGKQSVESKEYKIIVVKQLDRETIEQHNVTVVCHDYGVPQLTASANFIVVVMDENDNDPVFAQNMYESTISENNEEDYTVVQVYAKDADIDKNGLVSYYLNPEFSQNFSINANTGLIKAKTRFDRETQASYDIVVTAVDAGNPPRSSTVSVHIIIKDENDNEPIFRKPFYEYFPPESDLNEVVLGKVLADDKDEGGNGYVSYSLVGNYTELPFDVLPEGTVKSTGKLDREDTESYHFQIMAIDNGVDIRRSSIVNVTVHVTDINDNDPVLIFPKDPSFVKYITYMTPPETQVMKIEAADPDYGKNSALTYTVFGRNDSFRFEIRKDGEIVVARRLTEDDVDKYYLDVLISDEGVEPRSTSTRINLEILLKNVTAVSEPSSSIDQKNVIIAIVVVVVTLVIAVAILVIIWVVRRHDLQKRKYISEHNDQRFQNGSSDNDYSVNTELKVPDTVKVYDSSLLPSTYPVLPKPLPVDMQRADVKHKDVKFQVISELVL